MSDTTENKPSAKAPAKSERLQHVVAHDSGHRGDNGQVLYDDILVFGTELLALRHIVGKADWTYQALTHGQTFGAQA